MTTGSPWKPREPTPEEAAEFEGSIWQKLGYEKTLCPTCGAHTHDGICLNTCHLPKLMQERFAAMMREAALRGE